MSTAKSTVRHAAVYSFSSVLGKAVGFVMLPFYAHLLGVTGYGVIGMIDAALVLLTTLFSYSIAGSMTRFYHEEEKATKGAVISTGVLLVGGAGFAVAIPAAAFSRPMSWLLFDSGQYQLFLVLALGGFVFDLIGTAAKTYLVIRQRSVTFTVLAVLRLVTALGLNILLIVHLRLGLFGYFVASFTVSTIFSVVLTIIALRNCGVTFGPIAKKIIRFELPLVPGNLLSFASRQTERILVRYLVSLQGVGILEMAYKFPYLISIFISQPFMLSWNTKRTEIAEQQEAPVQIARMFTYYLFLALFAGLVLATNIGLILKILTPPGFWGAARIAQIEIVTLILMGSYYHLYFGLYYKKMTKTIGLIRSMCAIVKVGVSVVLIWMWGLYGAAYSALLMAGVQMVWAFRRSQRVYRLVIEYQKVLLLASTAAVMFVVLAPLQPLEPVASEIAGWAISDSSLEAFSSSSVGRWRDGAIVRVLQSRANLVLEVGLNTLVCTLYLLLLPAIRGQTSAVAWTRLGRVFGSQ